jgi:hypothetical protein
VTHHEREDRGGPLLLCGDPPRGTRRSR